MPIRDVKSVDEWFALTGERGSVYIETPAKRPAPRWKNLDPWHGELVAMPSFWETVERDDER